jgi:hypothetical protein
MNHDKQKSFDSKKPSSIAKQFNIGGTYKHSFA